MPGQFCRDMPCGERVDCQIAQHRLCLRFAVLRVSLAQQFAVARFVDDRGEPEPGAGSLQIALAGDAAHGPAGHRPRQFGHIGLAIAAAHAQRVQFENFAGKVFVEPDRFVPPRCAVGQRAVWTNRLRLIEIEQHRRMPQGRAQHRTECAEHVRANGLELKRPGQPGGDDLVDRHGEMIRPEVDQPLHKRHFGG